MNYVDDWQQFSGRFCIEVLWSCLDAYEAWGLTGQAHADFENMLLMGGEIAR